ncbi:hypothetical protein EYZ66_11565 [Aequoribacter fuscus]|uniref:HisA/HisF-related TIM barrel protein n=1 Tax=Aequoribacter fuscus TaxID=2518989 RepID=UPI0005949FEB|nr:HisA/HisF-related TIM barrel protein [Aequoribacter fuscus]QHJ88890.1 hypothetical protein EYZ66_11565 [Aequoribacter fuscus]
MRINIEILLKDYDCVKGEKFKNHEYIGCPLNIVKIYNDYSVDEICITQLNDIAFTEHYIHFLTQLSSISRCPLCYSGNIDSLEKIRTLFEIGFDKIKITNQNNFHLLNFVRENYGLQSLVIGFDIKINFFKKFKDTYNNSLLKIKEIINSVECSEYVLKVIKKEGTLTGFDRDILLYFSDEIKKKNIIYSGGISCIDNLKEIDTYIDNVSCGALFTFKGSQKGILPSYLSNSQLEHFRKGWKIDL